MILPLAGKNTRLIVHALSRIFLSSCEHVHWSQYNFATGKGGDLDPERGFDGRSGALIPAKSRDHLDWMVSRLGHALVPLHVVLQMLQAMGAERVRRKKNIKKIKGKVNVSTTFGFFCG